MSEPSPSAAAAAAGGGEPSDIISRMPEFPLRQRLGGHRRAQSEVLALPDDLDLDLVAPNEISAGGDADADADDDEILSMLLDPGGCSLAALPEAEAERPLPPVAAGPRAGRHQHSLSMDGSSSSEMALGGDKMSAEAKKAISDARLAELALVDPKRAKRILANRQSAARSKERKMRYIAELERKVQTLQTEATTLSAQLSLLQRDTTGLTAENGELKIRLQSMEQQVRLQDALNDALRDEIQQLKMVTGQVSSSNGGSTMGNFGSPSFGLNQQSYSRNHIQSLLAAQQMQQLQIHSPHQQPMHMLQAQQQLPSQPQQEPLQPDLKFRSATASAAQSEPSS